MEGQSDNPRIHCLLREVASLTASLQRETQRRINISAIAKEQERLIGDTQRKLRQVQYANQKLENELKILKTGESTKSPSPETPLHAEVERLQHALSDLQATSTRACVSEPSGVDSAVKQLEAIVPRHRATIAALQSRISVLTSQVSEVSLQRDELQKEVEASHQQVQHYRTAFAEASAKLHSQEAAALEETSTRSATVSALQAEVAAWAKRCQAAEAAVQEAEAQTQQLKRQLEATTQLAATQAETIVQLEETVNEQQDDILAALDLVCHHNKAPQSHDVGFETKHGIQQNEDGRNCISSWTIPAVVNGDDRGKGIGVFSPEGAEKKKEIVMAAPAKRRNEEAESVQFEVKGRARDDNSMAQLAADIASLQKALKEVM